MNRIINTGFVFAHPVIYSTCFMRRLPKTAALSLASDISFSINDLGVPSVKQENDMGIIRYDLYSKA